jgi:hypothetical protein
MAPRDSLSVGIAVRVRAKLLHPKNVMQSRFPNDYEDQVVDNLIVVGFAMKRWKTSEKECVLLAHPNFQGIEIFTLPSHTRLIVASQTIPALPQSPQEPEDEDLIQTDEYFSENEIEEVMPEETQDRPQYSWGPISVDARSAVGAENFCASLTNMNLRLLSVSAYFFALIPKKYIEDEVVGGTNAGTPTLQLSVPEFWGFLGIMFIMSLHPGYTRSEFWQNAESTSNSYTVHPPNLRAIMSRNRFNDIMQALRITSVPSPPFVDRFWQIRPLIHAFNNNMNYYFKPSWKVCVDESMVVWTSDLAPGWIVVKRKPHPFGNEYHTAACCETKIIYFIELVEGKDRPPQLPLTHLSPNDASGGKTTALLLRMTETIWGSGRVVILDSGFGVIKSGLALLERGVYCTMYLKKKRYWPWGSFGDEVLRHMADKPVGSIVTRKGLYNDKVFYLEAFKEAQFTSITMNTWGRSLLMPEGRPRKRRVNGQLRDIFYSTNLDHYYTGRHAVDDNNNIRQGSLSFETAWATKKWYIRQFAFIIALAETNACLAYNHFLKKKVTLIEFRRQLANELVDLWMSSQREVQEPVCGPRMTRSMTTHVLVTKPPHSGVWRNGEWTKTKQMYQKSVCTGENCNRMTRTYCSCNKLKMLCAFCYASHYHQALNDDD